MPVRVASTWPDGELLRTLRGSLDEAETALLCVAFVNQPGLRLVQPQLERLSSDARLLVTTVFSDVSVALNEAADWGVDVRTLNWRGGTFHPKMYLMQGGD